MMGRIGPGDNDGATMTKRMQCLLLGGLLVASLSALAADGVGPAAASGPATYLLVAKDGDAQTLTTRIPVQAAEGKCLQAQGAKVLYRDGRSDALAQHVHINFQPAAAGQVAVFVIEAPRQWMWPGSYALLLAKAEVACDGKGAPAKGKSQEMLVNLLVAAPQIVASTKVVLAEVRGGTGEPIAGNLAVWETSGKGNALQLQPFELHDPPANGEPVAAALAFTPAVQDLAASGVARFVVSPVGEFPLGVTRGRIQLRSPSLAAALDVPYEVRVRRTVWLILLCSLLGTLLGWFVRVRLSQSQKLLLAQSKVAAARRVVARTAQGVDDAPFQRALLQLLQRLDDELETRDPELIGAAAKKVEEDAAALVKKLNDGLPAVRARIDSLHALVDLQWRVPAGLEARLAELAGQVTAANDLLVTHNLEKSGELLTHIESEVLPLLSRDAADIVDRLTQVLDALGTQPFPMGAVASARWLQLRTEAGDAATTLGTPPAAAVDEAHAALKAVDRLQVRVGGFAAQAPDLARQLCAQAGVRLSGSFTLPEGALDSLESLGVSAAMSVQTILTDLKATLLGAPDLASVREAWRSLLLQLAPGIDRAGLSAALKEGRWLDATDLAVEAISSPDEAAEQVAARTARGALERLSDASEASATPVEPPQSRGTLLPPSLADKVAETTVQRLDLLRRARDASLLQSAGFGLVFVIAAFGLHAENWVGTYKEMATLFVLAFGVDLSSDGVLAALKKFIG